MKAHIKNLQVVVIHKKDSLPNQSGILKTSVSDEPLAAITLDGLMNLNPWANTRERTSIAIPETWEKELKSIPTPLNITYYNKKLPIRFALDSRKNHGQWLIISNGRYVTDVDRDWLFQILAEQDATVIAVTVDPQLTAFKEKIRINSKGKIAGFRRLYSDIAQTSPLPTDWPCHVFIRTDTLKNLMIEDTLPLSFPEFAARCETNSMTLNSLKIAGDVLDLETETGFLNFIARRIDVLWPKRTRGYMQIAEANNCSIAADARLHGKVVLGHNVKIDPGAIVLGPAVIGDNVHICRDAIVNSTVITAGKTVPEKYHLQNRVITLEQQFQHKHPSPQKQNHHSSSCYAAGVAVQKKNHENNFRVWPRFSYVRYLKRIGDIIAAMIFLILFAPVMPVLALAIKVISPGPVFFKDKRQGLHGCEFNCIKFRTMIVGADKIQTKLRIVSQVDGPQFKMEDDPRVSPIGRFLRDTCLDEIPQFFNVLMGQMSLVGPRPSPEAENSMCPPWRDARLSIRPGITGLWQISRTRQEGQDFQEWIYYDTKYVKNLSWRMDLWICWKTTKKLVWDFMRHF
ncbi:MAG: sugar transferase [Sedimentisphaerales bacterium]|nr:sugar transferase [Sedimentisphaerales bacterium]